MFLFGKKKKNQEEVQEQMNTENLQKNAADAAEEMEVDPNETYAEVVGEPIAKDIKREDMIEVYDAYGRKLYIGKKEWTDKVLPNQIKTNWDNADALYNIVVSGIQHNIVEEILEAAERLVDIDANKERSHVALSIAYMKNGDLKDAEDVLTEYIEANGKTGTVMTNLAKVYSNQGEADKSMETLWEGLQIDPNQENGLAWWLALQREKGGKEGYAKAILDACKIPGGYLPQLYRARVFAEAKDYEGALSQYDTIIKEHGDKEQALLMISGDMGRIGLVREMLDKVVPLYDVDNQDMRIGMNVLQGYLTVKDVEKGSALLDKLMLKNRPDLRPFLMQMSGQLDMLKGAAVQKSMPEENKMAMLMLEKPVWSYGLGDNSFLNLPAKQVGKGRVGFLVYSNAKDAKGEGAVAEREDAVGRLTRNIPLFLQELTYFYSEQYAASLFYILTGKGPVLNAKEWDKEVLRRVSADGQYDCLVTGNVMREGEKAVVKTLLYDVANDSTSEIEDVLEIQTMGTCLMQHVSKVFEAVTGKKLTEQACNSDCYTIPEEKYVYEYMIGLGQQFLQTLVENKAIVKDALVGERNMLDWYMKLCLSMEDNKQAPIMLAAGLSKSKSYGSGVYQEYRTQAEELVKNPVLAQKIEALYKEQ